ncbi:MAG: hypothetical protein Q8J70_11270 [Thiobacillus sp.]|nr:hypothetical protein [Thiobacillus sp.]
MRRFRQLLVVLGLALLATSRSSCGADVFAEATAGRNPTITPEYFGTHFHRLVLRPQENAVRTLWPDLRFGSVRFWDTTTRWADVAPKPGQWDFDRLDTYVGAANAHSASVLYTLGSTPRWASARPDERCSYGFGCAAEAVRLAHWEEYVRRVAQRYRGLIGAYELWNEPYFSDIARDRVQPAAFFSGSIANMVEMARAARRILDETSPGTILTTPGFVGETERLDRFLGAGGKAYVQVVSYHMYSGGDEGFVRRVLEVREVMRRHGIERLPLWNTEQGIEVYPEGVPMPSYVRERLTRTEAAARMAQVLVLGAAAGLERFYYYAWDNEHSGMVTRRGEHLPAYEAMARVQDWLIGARMAGCASPNRGVVSCRVELDKQTFLIAWASQPGEHSLKLPDGMKPGGVETLLSTTLPPAYQVRRGFVQIALGSEPVRIALDRQNQP